MRPSGEALADHRWKSLNGRRRLWSRPHLFLDTTRLQAERLKDLRVAFGDTVPDVKGVLNRVVSRDVV